MVTDLSAEKFLSDYARNIGMDNWLRQLVAILIKNDGHIEETEFETIVDMLLEPSKESETHLTAISPISEPSLRIKSLKHVSGVNALAPNETLRFCPEGITYIGGRNGSGKSGYARLLRGICGCQATPILGNIYLSPMPLEAEVEYIDETATTQKHTWNNTGRVSPIFKNVLFFDSNFVMLVTKKISPTEIVLSAYHYGIIKELETCLNKLQELVRGEGIKEKKIAEYKNDLVKKYFDKYAEALFASLQNNLHLLALRKHCIDKRINEDGNLYFVIKSDGSNSYSLGNIMSEGELKTVALALFFAQRDLTYDDVPIVLDDPVSSLDDKVVAKLVEKLIEIPNQIILFSHDFMLWEALKSRTKKYKFSVLERDRKDTKRHISYVHLTSEPKTSTGHVNEDEDPLSSAYYLERVNAMLTDAGFHDTDNIVINLRKAIEYLVDEKIFDGLTPNKFSGRGTIEWNKLITMCSSSSKGDIINNLRKHYERLSSAGTHAGIVSSRAPLDIDDLQEIFDDLKTL